MIKKRFLRKIKSNFAVNFRMDFLYGNRSFSQEGEDLILKKIIQGKKNGFYVDVGAHHPFRYSNTYLLYKSGWHGINIDATPGSMEAFNKVRPRDINIQALISDKKSEITYYTFEDSALNTYSMENAQAVINTNQSNLIKKINIKPKKLSSLFNRYLSKNTEIDLLNVDVEGTEFNVLKSNNWRNIKPKIILVEILNFGNNLTISDDISKYLHGKSYNIVANTVNSVLFATE